MGKGYSMQKMKVWVTTLISCFPFSHDSEELTTNIKKLSVNGIMDKVAKSADRTNHSIYEPNIVAP